MVYMMDEKKLIIKVAENDSAAFSLLCEKYMPLLESLIRRYSNDDLTREDKEDLSQEAQMLLLKAARTYNADSGLTFGLYAQICIKNGLISLARKRKSDIEKVSTDVSELDLAVPDSTGIIDEAESVKALFDKIKTVLSDKELSVFRYMILDYKNAQIASELGLDSKSVENAVFRIKKKLGELLL
jgi:RNA polymerase sporulation-specific sigma factor